MTYNRITVTIGALRRAVSQPINYQYDMTQILVVQGIELPEYYVVDFCNEGDASVIAITGSSDGAAIPDALLQTGKTIKAYIVLAGGEGDVQTRYEITIPVKTRPTRSDIDPTPAQQQQIDTLISALNAGVEAADQSAEDAEQSAEDADQSASDAEAWAVGQRGGADVSVDDPTYQNNAKHYAEQSEEVGTAKATLAESWAVGGTGTREGEDTNNAEFWSRMAREDADLSGWVYFYIDGNGHLHYVKTANCGLDFYIDDNGHLHVTNGRAT